MAWTSPRTWAAGETVTAALLNTHIRDNFKAMGDPWTSYTPTLAASGGGLALGTGGTQVGGYIAVGKLIIFRALITFGSASVTAGTGNYSILLPTTARSTNDLVNASARFAHTGSQLARPFPVLLSTTTVGFEYPAAWPSGAQTIAGAAAPWAWAVNDTIAVSGVFEAA